MIINMASHTIKTLWSIFLFIFLFITFLFIFLTNGIRVESLELPKVKISQLYIKLDKKLIVYIDTLVIDSQDENKSSLKEIHSFTSKLPLLHALFKKISIQSIVYNNKTIGFLYKDKVFHVDSDLLTIDAKIQDAGDFLEIDIKQMSLKDFQVDIKGDLKVDLRGNIFSFNGEFETFNIDGGIELKVEKKKLFYRIHTEKFESLKPFMDSLLEKIELHPIMSSWIYKKIVAKEYQVHNLEGKFDLNTLNFYPYLMKAKATAKNVAIEFSKDAPSVFVDELDIILENNQLIFDIKKADYQGKDVSNSEIHIYNLMTTGSGVVVNIITNTILDDSIHYILHAFDIDIPITQTSGKTKANVRLDIGFHPIGFKSYTGRFKVSDADITLAGVAMHSKKGLIELDNGMIYLKDVNLKYSNIFDIDTSGELNLTTGVYKSSNKINSLHVSFNELTLLDIENFNTTATMQIDDNKTTIYIDSLKTELKFLSNNNIISVEKLNLIYPYSPFMKDIGIKNGILKIDTLDFQNYEVVANLKNLNLPLRQNGNKIEELDLKIEINEEIVEAISSDKKIKFTNLGGKKLTIKDIDVAFDFSKQQEPTDMGQMTIVGINSNIIDTSSTLKILSHNFSLQLDGKNSFFNSRLFPQTVFIEQTKQTLLLEGKNLTSMFINTLLAREIFENGVFEFYADGKSGRDLDGTFKINDTTIKGMIFYNNLMAFMHTIPSLITFQNPGFNEDGFQVTSGFVEFSRDEDILTIDKLSLKGKSADVLGSGTVNLKTNTFDINLQISVLKNLATIIDVIPIVNYILLGEDGRVYTNIKVTGTLEKPKMKTYAIQDTLLTPLEIIQRVLETPFRIFK